MRATTALAGLLPLLACTPDRAVVPRAPSGAAASVGEASGDFVGTLVPLAAPSGAGTAEATAVNDAGYVVGTAGVDGCSRIVLWDPSGVPTVLPRCGRPTDINNRNQVVGTLDGVNQAFIWSPETGFVELGTLGGTWSRANAISEHGWVVGASERPGGEQTAFVYDPANGMRDLSLLIQRQTLEAVSVNANGEILVDWAPNGGLIATFVWSPTGGVRRLPKFHDWNPPGRGRAINDRGWVTGEARVAWLGDTRAALWIPGQAPISLGSLPPHGIGYSLGVSLSLDGLVVGYSQNHLDLGPRSFAWTSRMGIREFSDGTCGVSGVNRRGSIAAGNCHGGAAKWVF